MARATRSKRRHREPKTPAAKNSHRLRDLMERATRAEEAYSTAEMQRVAAEEQRLAAEAGRNTCPDSRNLRPL